MSPRFEGDYRSSIVATLVLIGALAGFVVLSEISIWATFKELDLWENAFARNEFVAHEAAADERRKALTGGFQLFSFVVACVLFIRWLRVMTSNAGALGATGMRFGPRTAVAWWFVPVFHLWKPHQVLHELFQASHPEFLEDWKRAPVSRLLSLWWTLWITFQVTVALALVADLWARSADQLYIAAWGSAILSVFGAPLGIAAAIGAWRLQTLQRARARCTAPLRVRQPWPTRARDNELLLDDSVG